MKNAFGIYKFISKDVLSYAHQKTDIHYAFINNTHDRNNRTQYYDYDDIFLRFSSPISGSLCVYLVDENQEVFCILPYSNSKIGCQNIDANTDYLFFSSTTDPNAEEYTLNTQNNIEQNALYLIFTPNELTKANDKQSDTNWRNEQLPRQLKYNDFISWLAKIQIRDPNLMVRTEIITIRK